MAFTSTIFLFVFFPICIVLYALAAQTKDIRVQNAIMIVASGIFYAWGGIEYCIYLFIGIIINYYFGLVIGSCRHKPRMQKAVFIISIACNLLFLGICKYFGFFINIIADIIRTLNPQFAISSPNIPLPLGISFIMFQIISYLADIYKGKIQAQRNVAKIILYFMFFPKLLMGPITRYEDMEKQLYERTFDLENIYAGGTRFLRGFIKKILLANQMAIIADAIFEIDGGNNFIIAWVGAIAYTLQIYIDFSSYSDMAIGLARIFGFVLPENFNYPYLAKSIQEFWQRWHITLSSWFKDYVYIPLGGNRVARWKLYRNLGVVFLLTGIWHGANWTFILWGVFHGIFQILERIKLKDVLKKLPNFVSHFYTMVVVIIGWVLFRADSLKQAIVYMKSLFTFRIDNLWQLTFWQNITIEFTLLFIVSVFACVPIPRRIKQSYNTIVRDMVLIVLFIVAIYYMIIMDFNPFIYLRF